MKKGGSGKFDSDWWCGCELVMLDMLKHYTLEQLQKTDIDLLLPLYFWYCRQNEGSESAASDEKVVMRCGKPYRVIKADEIGNIF